MSENYLFAADIDAHGWWTDQNGELHPPSGDTPGEQSTNGYDPTQHDDGARAAADDGAALLNDVHAAVRTYVVLPSTHAVVGLCCGLRPRTRSRRSSTPPGSRCTPW